MLIRCELNEKYAHAVKEYFYKDTDIAIGMPVLGMHGDEIAAVHSEKGIIVLNSSSVYMLVDTDKLLVTPDCDIEEHYYSLSALREYGAKCFMLGQEMQAKGNV